MKIEITRVTDWQRVVDAARFTQGKKSLGHDADDADKHDIQIQQEDQILLAPRFLATICGRMIWSTCNYP